MPKIEIRVKDSELETIKENAAGSASISDYARATMLRAPSQQAVMTVPALSDRWMEFARVMTDDLFARCAKVTGSDDAVVWASAVLAGLLHVERERHDSAASEHAYEGWTVMPAPDGSVDGYLEDETQKMVKWIQPPQPSKLRPVRLERGDRYYDKF